MVRARRTLYGRLRRRQSVVSSAILLECAKKSSHGVLRLLVPLGGGCRRIRVHQAHQSDGLAESSIERVALPCSSNTFALASNCIAIDFVHNGNQTERKPRTPNPRKLSTSPANVGSEDTVDAPDEGAAPTPGVRVRVCRSQREAWP